MLRCAAVAAARGGDAAEPYGEGADEEAGSLMCKIAYVIICNKNKHTTNNIQQQTHKQIRGREPDGARECRPPRERGPGRRPGVILNPYVGVFCVVPDWYFKQVYRYQDRQGK